MLCPLSQHGGMGVTQGPQLVFRRVFKRLMRIIVTGGAGFIGSELVRQLIRETEHTVINVDKLTYAGNLDSLEEVAHSERYYFEHADICDLTMMRQLFERYQPSAIMHLAAESHVDRSIDGPGEFLTTNVIGTYVLLEASREYMKSNSSEARSFRFHHVSTDEVYGSLGESGSFTEETRYNPSSPYSASKAASDHLVRAWERTFGLPTVITNCSNNFGPFQYPEKLIPLTIISALGGKVIPVYGDGGNVRDWLYVEDHCRALRLVLESASVGKVYNIGGNNERTNLQVVSAICALLDELRPQKRSFAEQIQFVADRPGHDRRYALDTGLIRRELNWEPREGFSRALRKTVCWYLENEQWYQRILRDGRPAERQGVAR